jgi:hypothetical protein
MRATEIWKLIVPDTVANKAFVTAAIEKIGSDLLGYADYHALTIACNAAKAAEIINIFPAGSKAYIYRVSDVILCAK